MNFIKIIKFLIPLIILISCLELGSRYILKWEKSSKEFPNYTSDELDSDIPFIKKINGGDCVKVVSSFHWNQWWGFNNRNLNLKCAKNHFSEKTFNIVFMGGSAMDLKYAPNYLTTIDYYSTLGLKNVHTINLAESGARHMNMSVRFQREVIPLNPDLVIFFDGFNEFNSIKYNGSPYDDFYWTATGKNRMHSPYKLYIDKAIELSAFFELALVHTGIYTSSRNVTGVSFDKKATELTAKQYLLDKKNTKYLCKSYKINCLFVIQPHIYSSKIEEHSKIIDFISKNIPHEKKILEYGYKIILENCYDCIDMSMALINQKKTFFDSVHSYKNGSKILGGKFKKLIEQYINKD